MNLEGANGDSRRSRMLIASSVLVVGLCLVAGLYWRSADRPRDQHEGHTAPLPESWKSGAVERIMDGLYVAEIPTFTDGGRVDAHTLLAAYAVAHRLDVTTEAMPLASTLKAAGSADEAVDLIVDWMSTDQPVFSSDRDLIDKWVAKFSADNGFDLSSLAMMEAYFDLPLMPTGFQVPPCVSMAALSDDASLYMAGASAQIRVSLGAPSCPVAGELPAVFQRDDENGLTPELIERTRAIHALVAEGSLHSDVADAADARIEQWVIRQIDELVRSRAGIELLFQAMTVHPSLEVVLEPYRSDVSQYTGRTIRWLGSLPDSTQGANAVASAEAIRSLRTLEDADASAFEFVRGTVLMPYFSTLESGPYDAFLQQYRMVLSAAMGDVEGLQEAARVFLEQSNEEELLPTTVLALASRGPCLDGASYDRLVPVVRTLSPYHLAALQTYAGRCGFELDELGSVEAPAGASLYERSAVSCTATGHVAEGEQAEARRLVRETPAEWPSLESQLGALQLPSFESIYTLTVAGRLAVDSCDGYWWIV